MLSSKTVTMTTNAKTHYTEIYIKKKQFFQTFCLTAKYDLLIGEKNIKIMRFEATFAAKYLDLTNLKPMEILGYY